ncbi:MAG: Bug family tripartite tricarboxylate transporter substrate binding protein [Ramlibacter sp.]
MPRIPGAMAALLAPLLLMAQPPAAQAADPHRPVVLVVGFPPGSQPDLVARLLGQALAESLRKPVLIENVVGAAGNIAAERVARAAPDGDTIGLLSQTQMAVNPALYRLPYDPLKAFAPISLVTVSPNLLVVNRDVPARSVPELVALARSQPGSLTYASSGIGTGTHMAAALFMASAGVDVRHIPYKGVVAALPDLVAGRVAMMFSPLPVVLPLVREGKLRALAVTSLERSPVLPQLPTVAESGYPGFEATNWYGLVAPAGTDPAIVRRLSAEAIQALGRPGLRDRLAGLGLDVTGTSPDQFAALVHAELPKWSGVVKTLGIKPDQ